MQRRLLLNIQQAKILFAALQFYQEDNASLIHGWTLTKDADHDTEIYTGLISVWGEVEDLKKHISNTFPENPAY